MATGNSINAPDTAYSLIVGAGPGYAGIAADSTSGIPLISAGASSNPAYGTALVVGGGTGAVTFTAYAPVIAGTTATGAFQSASTGLATSGYVLTSNGSSAVPSFQAPSSVLLPFTVVTAATQNIAVNTRYGANAASGGVAFTLPTTATVGQVFQIVGFATGSGWSVVQNASQYIQLGSNTTTVGTGGSLASTNSGDCIEVVCIVANNGFVVQSSMGNITYV